jgi:adenosylcobinamide-GDP ribazoletransferase
MGFLIAFRFLTIFPLFRNLGKGKEDFGKALPYFPLVGLSLGVMLSLVYYFLSFFLPNSINCLFIILALVIMTGAHHLDGLMDTFDGAVSGKSRDRRLEIMADSRVGAFGIIAAILLLLLKYVALSSMNGVIVVPGILLMTVLSRWIMVTSLAGFPYARGSGLGLEFKRGANWKRTAVASAFSLIISLLFVGWWGIALMAAIWLVTFGIASYFSSRLGGLTGDVYGALNEISEVLVLLILLLFWRL